ncbi:hypothetical protein [Bacillus sp. mrc49]|uniref:hypothetical protein n=1 Tax=Bacillus sp. mrc49 TaxID=2054913 RepID=UPI000C27E858|nr:hypothetical protein [Bacillus sp. mrc49]PJN90975.1 hypothetical protein CVN76_07230 [Bacillus sp. mrc49]
MTVEQKKALREEKLQALYDHNEKAGGRPAGIKYTDLYENEEDKQEHLAYEYLHDKGLIDYKILGRNTYHAKITSRGIDRIEEG